MTEFILLLLFLIPAMLGIAEILHIFKLYVLKPREPMISYKVVVLTDGTALAQLRFVAEQYIWSGKSGDDVIIVNSLLNEENFKECKKIAQNNNFIYCSADELGKYLKAVTG